jgi:hypothetical protein
MFQNLKFTKPVIFRNNASYYLPVGNLETSQNSSITLLKTVTIQASLKTFNSFHSALTNGMYSCLVEVGFLLLQPLAWRSGLSNEWGN